MEFNVVKLVLNVVKTIQDVLMLSTRNGTISSKFKAFLRITNPSLFITSQFYPCLTVNCYLSVSECESHRFSGWLLVVWWRVGDHYQMRETTALYQQFRLFPKQIIMLSLIYGWQTSILSTSRSSAEIQAENCQRRAETAWLSFFIRQVILASDGLLCFRSQN